MTSAVDMWGVGVICYILLVGFHPIQARSDKERTQFISQGIVSYDYPSWKKVSKEAKEFLTHLLTPDPNLRYTAKDALEHPWIKVLTIFEELTTLSESKRLVIFKREPILLL
jgi:serine/threonine protein kinase